MERTLPKVRITSNIDEFVALMDKVLEVVKQVNNFDLKVEAEIIKEEDDHGQAPAGKE